MDDDKKNFINNWRSEQKNIINKWTSEQRKL